MLSGPVFMGSMAASGSRVQPTSVYNNLAPQYGEQHQQHAGSMASKSLSSSQYKQQVSLPSGSMTECAQRTKGRTMLDTGS